MFVLAMSMVAGFVVASLLRESLDDDDGPGGGMMFPAQNPN